MISKTKRPGAAAPWLFATLLSCAPACGGPTDTDEDVDAAEYGAAPQNDMGTGQDAGDTFATATVPAVLSGTGALSAVDKYDHYKIAVVAGQMVELSLAPPSGANFDLALLSPSGTVLASSAKGAGVTETIEHHAATSGDYRVRASRSSGKGKYGLSIAASGEPPIAGWARRYVEDPAHTFTYNYFYRVQETPDGFIVAGQCSGFGSNTTACVTKLGPKGEVIWNKSIGFIGSGFIRSFTAYALAQTSNGYILAASGIGATPDAWVVKLGFDGSIQWNTILGGLGGESASHIEPLSDGGFLVVGTTSSFGAGNSDIWAVKLTASGTIAWQKTYGGVQAEHGSYAKALPAGGFLLVGSTASFGAGSDDTWVLRLSADGSPLWQKTYGDAAAQWGTHLHLSSDGGFVVLSSAPSAGDFIGVMKLDAAGAIQWQKRYDGPNKETSHYYSLHVMDDGGLVLGGQSDKLGTDTISPGRRDVFLALLDSGGNISWARQYDVHGAAFMRAEMSALWMTSDGGLVGAGSMYGSPTNFAAWGAFLLKVPMDGALTPIASEFALTASQTSFTSTSTAVTAATSAAVAGTDTTAAPFDTTANITVENLAP